MRKRPLGNTGLSVSELGLGTWGLSGDGYAPVPESVQDAVIERALALGITLFDTSDSYARGAMEMRLGERLEKHPEALIVTKLGTDRDSLLVRKSFDPAFIKESFERSRARLRRDVVDVVLLHNPSSRALARGQATAALAELKEKGAIRAWGASVEGMSAAREALKQGAQVLELAFNAFHCSEFHQLAAEIETHQVGVLARSVLAHGLLCGQWPIDKDFANTDHRAERWTTDDLKRRISQLNALRPCIDGSNVTSLRSVALRFVLSNQAVSSALLGPRSALQLDQLLRDSGKEPPYLEQAVLDALFMRLDSVRVHT